MKAHKIELLFTPKSNEQKATNLQQKLEKKYPKDKNDEYNYSNKGESQGQSFKIDYMSIHPSLKTAIYFEKKGRPLKREILALEDLAHVILIDGQKEKWNCYYLQDDVSKSFQKQLNDLLYDYETNLRRLMYLLLPQSVSINWENTIPNETRNDAQGRTGGAATNNILQHLTLGQIEDYLFSESYISILDDEGFEQDFNFTQVDTKELIAVLSAMKSTHTIKPYTIWSKYFKRLSSGNIIDIPALMGYLRDARNTVGHFKTIKSKKYDDWRIKIKQLIAEIQLMSDKIIQDGFSETDSTSIYVDLESIISKTDYRDAMKALNQNNDWLKHAGVGQDYGVNAALLAFNKNADWLKHAGVGQGSGVNAALSAFNKNADWLKNTGVGQDYGVNAALLAFNKNADWLKHAGVGQDSGVNAALSAFNKNADWLKNTGVVQDYGVNAALSAFNKNADWLKNAGVGQNSGVNAALLAFNKNADWLKNTGVVQDYGVNAALSAFNKNADWLKNAGVGQNSGVNAALLAFNKNADWLK
ncbi:hypothetical protein P7E04_19980, partial [Enterococcus hulanensis]